MDFEYHYTEEQDRFRREVSAWLDVNIPQDIERSGGLQKLDPALWEQCRLFQRRLGEKGWLASPDSVEGDGLSADLALIFLEELGKRNLGWLLEGGASSLQSVIQRWGTEEQKSVYLPILSAGQANIWHLPMEPGAEPDTGNLGIQAFRDGDDIILNGQDIFAGQGLWPDYLWTLAVTDAEAPPEQATATFLVPSALEGIRIQISRSLVPDQGHRVTFDNVRVFPNCLLGDEGKGWSVMQSTTLAEPEPQYHTIENQEVVDLLQYAQETTRDGDALIKEPVLQQLLVEAYINSQIARLFRMRNAWMAATGQELTYHTDQVAMWEKQVALRLSRIVRDVMGIYALLDHQDPRSPFHGRFELQQRRSLSIQNPTGAYEVHAAAVAKHLGLGQRKEETTAPAQGTPTGVSGSVDV